MYCVCLRIGNIPKLKKKKSQKLNCLKYPIFIHKTKLGKYIEYESTKSFCDGIYSIINKVTRLSIIELFTVYTLQADAFFLFTSVDGSQFLIFH